MTRQSYIFPRITTRGNYDLWTGKEMKTGYRIYPKKKFDHIFKSSKEVVIFVHGMRNTRYGAQKGGKILRRKLRHLGYKKHPVVAFSYDADIRGAHKYDDYDRIIQLAESIAKKNGWHLVQFVNDLKKSNPLIKIHLVGHSLGCVVIQSFLKQNRNYIHSIHYFGSPVTVYDIETVARERDFGKFINYHNPKDEDIRKEMDAGRCKNPSCIVEVGHMNPSYTVKFVKMNEYVCVKNRCILKNVKCIARDHRFKSYMEKLRRFP